MWFERLMGFAEESPDQVRKNIQVDGEFLVSRVNGRRVRWGRLAMPSLAELRAACPDLSQDRASLDEIVGNVQKLHEDPENAGALFQAASQFNLLEMTGPHVTPEQGVAIYTYDGTQGPSCAIACGGGTIYRNYFVPLDGHVGQTADRQIDCLIDLGDALGGPGLWAMRNGYALPTQEGLERVNARLAAANDDERDRLRDLLRIGVQHDVEVLGTDHLVTQVYGAALPVTYGEPPLPLWEPLARLILEASYEATLRVAQAQGIDTLFLTRLGGGVFGNEERWIDDALLYALHRAGKGLTIHIVSFGQPSLTVAAFLDRYAAS